MGHDAGWAMYWLALMANAGLATELRIRGMKDSHSCFFYYTIARLAQTMILIPWLLVGKPEMYSRFYWASSPLFLLVSLLVLCELFPGKIRIGKREFRYVHHSIIALAVAVCIVQAIHPTIEAERYVQTAIAVSSAYVLLRKVELGIALGLFIATFPSAIAERLEIILHGDSLRFIPSYAFLVAQIIWIVWVRRLESQPRSPELLR